GSAATRGPLRSRHHEARGQEDRTGRHRTGRATRDRRSRDARQQRRRPDRVAQAQPGQWHACRQPGRRTGQARTRAAKGLRSRVRKRTDSLGEYRARRNFRRTPEPDGRTAGRGTRQRDSSAGRPAAEARLPAFVVQRHEARSLHWDFRLELDGVLKSWAVPKGPSADPATRRLAVQVEDHPLAYRDFEGTIPAGQYGAGAVSIWDEGRWESTEDPHVGLAQGKLHFALHGRRLRGQWTLVRTGAGPNWLLFKDRVRPARSPLGTRLGTPPGTPAGLPETLKPQLATAATRLPDDPDTWLYELKFDGYRVLMRRDGRATRLY